MAHLPTFLSIAFGATRPLAVWFFHEAASNSWRVPSLLGLWLLQSLVALRGFYLVTDSWPPRLLLVLLPSALVIATLFLTTAGRRFLDGLQLDRLTLLHLVRIPVELVLWRLFLHRAVPQLMTFEGRNWDILLGLSAPII